MSTAPGSSLGLARSEHPTWTLEGVAALSREKLFALFDTLSAPTLREMDGEFVGHLPDYSRDVWLRWSSELKAGMWLGKAYRPEAYGRWPGRGYNRWDTQGKGQVTERHMRFAWAIESSTFTTGTSLVMYYGPFKNWSGEQDLLDEIRVVSPGLYLGAYHTREPVPGFTPRQGRKRSEPEIFMLTGPVGPWVGAEGEV